jgi:hypothetical protein
VPVLERAKEERVAVGGGGGGGGDVSGEVGTALFGVAGSGCRENWSRTSEGF